MRIYLPCFEYDAEGMTRFGAMIMEDYSEREAIPSIVNKARGASIRSTWQPRRVCPWWPELLFNPPPSLEYLLEHKPVADITFGDVIIVSRRAREGLGEMLEQGGELLPLISDFGEYYLYNVTRTVDALDLDKSLVDWLLPEFEGQIASRVRIYSLKESALRGVHVFRLPQLGGRGSCHVSEAFKQKAEALGLVGIRFDLVWDSEDPDFRDGRYSDEGWERIKAYYEYKKNPPAPVQAAAPPARRETPLDASDQAAVEGMLQEALGRVSALVGTKLTPGHPPAALAQHIFTCVERLRADPRLVGEERENRAIELGVLWGEQVCRAHGWHWAKVEDYFAVVAPDGSAYVPPVVYLFGFFYDPHQENTTLLLFNMIGAKGKIPAKPGAYLRID